MNNKECEIYDKYAYDKTFNYVFLVYMEFERRVNGREEYEELKKGECRFDYVSWERRLNITHKRMINAIKILIKEDYIEQRRRGRKGISSIYYLNRFLQEQRKEQNEEQKKYSNINDLNYIKEQNEEQKKVQSSKNNISKNNIFIENSNEMELSKLLFSLIQRNNPNHKNPNFQQWSKQFDYILRIDKRNIQEITRVIKWCQNDNFWKTNILSPKKLRDKYDMLYLKMITDSRKNQNYNYEIMDLNDTREKYYK